MGTSDQEPPSAPPTVAAANKTHVYVTRFELRLVDRDDVAPCSSSGVRTVIGSHPSADLVVDDPTMSRFHAELVIDGGKVVVKDLGSRNGTLVNGVSIRVAELDTGAKLTLGRTVVEFVAGTDSNAVPLAATSQLGGLVGQSDVMRAVFSQLELAAQSTIAVLLEGETGTGKELAAEAIHQLGPRNGAPLVVVDCGALRKNLLESELFGHEAGAFTGADALRIGAFEEANGGTILLDGVDQLDTDLQPKLLGVLERKKIQRIGSSTTIPVDIRVISTASRSLQAEVNARRFRADLYHRVAQLTVTLPPLRERTDDIDLLLDSVLKEMGASELPVALELRSPRSLGWIAAQEWPGNIRELRNHVERVLAVGIHPAPHESQSVAAFVDLDMPLRVARERCLGAFERAYLGELLAANDGNVSRSARVAGVGRVHLHRLLAKYGLRGERR